MNEWKTTLTFIDFIGSNFKSVRLAIDLITRLLDLPFAYTKPAAITPKMK